MSSDPVLNDNQENDVDETIDPVLSEEYKVWKKNSPFLYDFVMTHSLEWPSLTSQFLPDVTMPTNNTDPSMHKLIIGTQSDGVEPNYLMIVEVALPNPNAPIIAKQYNDERTEVGGFGGSLSKMNVKVQINHDGEVHRARYMPQEPRIIATRSPRNEVLIFDWHKHPSRPTDNVCHPQHRCHGLNAEGYGISWNPLVQGHLLSCASDGDICLWDIKSNSGVDISSLRTFSGHSAGVEDIDWSKYFPNIFGSVGDDSLIAIWDTRESSDGKPTKKVAKAHDSDINCISFNPKNEHLFATGGSDGIVKLWDLRKLDKSIHDMPGHKAGVYQLSWSPFDEYIIASSSEDRRVNVWDTSRIGEEQSPEDAEDGPPELLFIHGGHTAKVFDFSWNANEPWFVASVAEDNVLQVWQMSESIYNEEDEEDDDNENLEDLEDNGDEASRKKQKV